MSVTGILGVLRSLEKVTRPPRLGHDVDIPVVDDGEAPNLTEPGLSDDELVGVRQLLEERFGDQIGTAQSPLRGSRPAAVSDPPDATAAGHLNPT